MTDDKLKTLSGLTPPSPDPLARDRALEAAMVAFDHEVSASEQENRVTTQGTPRQPRTTSTLNQLWSIAMNSIFKPVLTMKPASLASVTGIMILPVVALVAWNVSDQGSVQ